VTWTGKSVLVTGAGGFIGSHLAESLVRAGASTRVLVHYNALGKAGWLDESPVRNDIDVRTGDITDRDSVTEAMKGVEVVFHLAALIAIPYSYHAPASYVRTNVEGTLNVLQSARASEVGRVVHTSTSEVYGTARSVPISETHPLQGQSPYSASKIGADKIAESFHLSFGLPIVTVRPFNTFGPRQSARAVVPTIIAQCLTSDTARLGSLHPTRDLNYVSNIAEGFLLAGSVPEAVGQTINLGSGTEISVEELARVITRLVNRDVKLERDEQRIRPDGSEVDRLVANNTLARKILGWKPGIDLEEGLKLTIEWMRQHLDRYRPYDYVV
jgi:NAD dependent epimerase/dehydratase